MRRSRSVCLHLAAFAALLSSSAAYAQFVQTSPSGDNQRSSVRQAIGPVEVAVDYSSPNVHAPDGTDRRGKIWGELVPWGLVNLNFGTCGEQCPWRGGDTAGATQVFELNAKRFPNQWPVNVGLMRAYAAAGKNKEALKAARAALTQAPDDLNRDNLKSLIAKLEKGDNAIH